jgi:hypothetical protein
MKTPKLTLKHPVSGRVLFTTSLRLAIAACKFGYLLVIPL